MNVINDGKKLALPIKKIVLLGSAVTILVATIVIRSRVQKAEPPEPLPPVTTNMREPVLNPQDHGPVRDQVSGDMTVRTQSATAPVAGRQAAKQPEEGERRAFLVRLDSVSDGLRNAQSMLRGSAPEQLVHLTLDRLESDLLSETNAPQLRERPELRQKWLNAISNYRSATGFLSLTNKPHHKEICAYGMGYVARDLLEVRAAIDPNQRQPAEPPTAVSGTPPTGGQEPPQRDR